MKIPQHLAIIMDGNGRWAQQRGLPRSAGHKAGYEHIPKVLEICFNLGIEVVSGFLWSTENWARPPGEVRFIMQSVERYLSRFVKELDDRNIRFQFSGSRANLKQKSYVVWTKLLHRQSRMDRISSIWSSTMVDVPKSFMLPVN
ncbi:undecaprenyl diphosphate synthase family protein [Chloroflexi bacterium TSY]|nr:undecaprenyl diphosphate synthase family protein [Chloroflexi bacterium TSY]